MAYGPDYDSKGWQWLIEVAGWLSLAGLLAVGFTGVYAGQVRGGDPQPAGAAYLLVGGLAFGTILALVLRRRPPGRPPT